MYENFSEYYDLENYLFSKVSKHYDETKTISVFDFFCIVIWKANRSKSKVAKRLLARGYESLDSAVKAFVEAVSSAPDTKSRLRVVVQDWGFRLPMASAILTVMFPAEFTVYDVRVCDMLGDFKDAQQKARFEELWARYEQYIQSVRVAASGCQSLRDKDRWLWGKSFALQLRRDIETKFSRGATSSGGRS